MQCLQARILDQAVVDKKPASGTLFLSLSNRCANTCPCFLVETLVLLQCMFIVFKDHDCFSTWQAGASITLLCENKFKMLRSLNKATVDEDHRVKTEQRVRFKRMWTFHQQQHSFVVGIQAL